MTDARAQVTDLATMARLVAEHVYKHGVCACGHKYGEQYPSVEKVAMHITEALVAQGYGKVSDEPTPHSEDDWVDVPIGRTFPLSARAVRRVDSKLQYIPKQEEQ